MLEQAWYRKAWWLKLLLPLSWVFQFLSTTRRRFLKLKADSLWTSPVPVLVVGNINVGGTGKTPLLINLVQALQDESLKVGVISRGYGGSSDHYPLQLTETSTAEQCGDEPLMIYQRLQVPVVVDPNRVRAAQHLLQNFDCDVIISDDGLQHYKLKRDIELVVIDAERGLGNGYCLPAGPLRESPGRLSEVDMVVVNGQQDKLQLNTSTPVFAMNLEAQAWINCKSGERKSLEDFYRQYGEMTLQAVAGIGNPDRFFATLTRQHYRIEPHRFSDHYQYSAEDFVFNADHLIVMTEKDKVKCQAFATENMWYLQVESVLPDQFSQRIVQALKQVKSENT